MKSTRQLFLIVFLMWNKMIMILMNTNGFTLYFLEEVKGTSRRKAWAHEHKYWTTYGLELVNINNNRPSYMLQYNKGKNMFPGFCLMWLPLLTAHKVNYQKETGVHFRSHTSIEQKKKRKYQSNHDSSVITQKNCRLNANSSSS